MSNSNRHNPVINGFKICKLCNLNKELTTQFTFHSPYNCYLGKCKDCENKLRKEKYILKSGRRDGSKFIKQKTCIKCNTIKDTNSENFGKSGGAFSNICRDCSNREKKIRLEERLNKGYLPDTSTKTCVLCKIEQYIPHFSFSKTGYYSSYCKTCDVKRKQKSILSFDEERLEIHKEKHRQYHHKNKPSYLLNCYTKFDNNKGLFNDLDIDFLKDKLKESCVYCGYSSTGLDRVDNSKGHLKSNCVPACKVCNVAKMDNFSYDEMLILGKTIKEIKDKRLLKQEFPIESDKYGLYVVGIDPYRQINKN